ncbi:Uncharacterized phage-associated protein [Anaerostipes hadrus]|uniref:Uncharacterized phage-associated protein n=1 Tax=Anaerostipes hadrus TaxID=649756 RepID=A0A174PLM0_ANAHA|nr:hypothetical protein [Anaerostipes hadrus]CUP62134.1 Uncharacterized phage-associated protein [Anaerostipes hadrus]
MANVFDAAKYILERLGEMSTMKLQKLCYYAQAWSLVWDDVPLFDGYMVEKVFNILWYDDNHGDNNRCVCRSYLKHT